MLQVYAVRKAVSAAVPTLSHSRCLIKALNFNSLKATDTTAIHCDCCILDVIHACVHAPPSAVLQPKEEAKDAAATQPAAPAPAPSAAAEVASMRTASGSLRMAVARRASSFRQQHFQAGGEASGLETEGLQKLRQLCNQLGQDDDSCVAELLEVRCLVAARWWLLFG